MSNLKTHGLFLLFACLLPAAASAAVFGSVRGAVHDLGHRPVQAAEVLVKSDGSDFAQKQVTYAEGSFEATALPAGEYALTVTKAAWVAGAE